MTWTTWTALGGTFGGLAVAFGAFGAHALKARLTPDDLAIFETGVKYQMYHALALLALGFVTSRLEAPALKVAGFAFLAGILIFSGTLYAMALGAPRILGAVTPLGGLALIAGWASLVFGVVKAAS